MVASAGSHTSICTEYLEVMVPATLCLRTSLFLPRITLSSRSNSNLSRFSSASASVVPLALIRALMLYSSLSHVETSMGPLKLLTSRRTLSAVRAPVKVTVSWAL